MDSSEFFCGVFLLSCSHINLFLPGYTSCQKRASCVFLRWMLTIQWPSRNLTTCTAAGSLSWMGMSLVKA